MLLGRCGPVAFEYGPIGRAFRRVRFRPAGHQVVVVGVFSFFAVLLWIQMLQMKSNFSWRSSTELDATSGIGADRALFTMKNVFHVPHDTIVAAHRLIGQLKTIGPMRGDALLLPRDKTGRRGGVF